MNEADRLKEMLNRLYWCLEQDPDLSGMMTDEFQGYLMNLSRNCEWGGVQNWTPSEPDFEIDLGL